MHANNYLVTVNLDWSGAFAGQQEAGQVISHFVNRLHCAATEDLGSNTSPTSAAEIWQGLVLLNDITIPESELTALVRGEVEKAGNKLCALTAPNGYLALHWDIQQVGDLVAGDEMVRGDRD